MKLHFLITIIIVFISFTSCGEKSSQADIPSIVLNTFNLEFKNVEDIEWKKNGDTYEVGFEIENSDYLALIKASGHLIKYKKELKWGELPEAVKTAYDSHSTQKNIGDIDLVVIGTEQNFQIEIEGRLTNSYVILNQAGEEVKDAIYFD